MYKCICGKEFSQPNKFNGHKSHCKTHHLHKYGNLDVMNMKNISASDTLRKKAQEKKANLAAEKCELLNLWILEKHSCERCGKIMTEKFGSGRFCSRRCANSGHVQKNNPTRSISAHNAGKILGKKRHAETLVNYYNNPRYCDICGTILPWERRNRKTCSKECYSAKRANIRLDTINQIGLTHGNLHNYKFGFYKGIECDSSWELAFLLYHLDIGSNIKRNSDKFAYDFNGKTRTYCPDFIIDNVYYEIKGYKDDAYFEKVNQFPKDQALVIIDKDLIPFYLQYAVKHYGDNFTHLYDNDRRSWRNHNVC